MNISNILKVADAIEQASVPGLGFNMDYEFLPVADGEDKSGHNCGTVACIAGWACAVEHGVSYAATMCSIDIAEEGQRLFGISSADRSALFYPYSLLEAIEPAHAARVLRNLAITGKVDWEAAMKPAEPVLPPLPVSKSVVRA